MKRRRHEMASGEGVSAEGGGVVGFSEVTEAVSMLQTWERELTDADMRAAFVRDGHHEQVIEWALLDSEGTATLQAKASKVLQQLAADVSLQATLIRLMFPPARWSHALAPLPERKAFAEVLKLLWAVPENRSNILVVTPAEEGRPAVWYPDREGENLLDQLRCLLRSGHEYWQNFATELLRSLVRDRSPLLDGVSGENAELLRRFQPVPKGYGLPPSPE